MIAIGKSVNILFRIGTPDASNILIMISYK